MGTDDSETWQPRSRVGAVMVALLVGDEDAAERVVSGPQDDKEPEVLAAAVRLAIRSLFDEDTPPELIADHVAAMAQDIEVDQAVARALIRAQLGQEHDLDDYPSDEVIDTTWSVFGYLCERRLGREESIELIAQAEREAL